MWLFFIFVAIPIIEIALFIQIGGWLGLFPTLAIVILTAALGTFLLRQQGTLAMNQLRGSFQSLNDPSEPLAHGAMILFAGALLLTPGFFTDAVGFSLMVPAIRSAAFQALKSRVRVNTFHVKPDTTQYQQRNDAIDGEFHEVKSENSTKRGNSGWTDQ